MTRILISALILELSANACAARSTATSTPQNAMQGENGEKKLLEVQGQAAQQLFDLLMVLEANPESELGGNAGIDPLRTSKVFVSSDNEFSLACEIRVSTQSCYINGTESVQNNAANRLSVNGKAAGELFDVLKLKASTTGGKLFNSKDGKFSISCDKSLSTNVCTLTSR